MTLVKNSNNSFKLNYEPKMRFVVLSGKEPFLLSEYTKQIIENLKKEFSSIDQIIFDGKNTSPIEILDEARTWGLLGNHKLVVVDGADELLKDTKEFNVRHLFEKYASEPNQDTTMLFRSSVWRKGNLDKAIISNGGMVFLIPNVNEKFASAWCQKRSFSKYQINISSPACDLLVKRVGSDLIKLDSEIGKLSTYVTNRLEVKDIKKLIRVSKEEEIWELQKAITSGQVSCAIKKLNELQEISGYPSTLIIWSVMEMLKKVYEASLLFSKKENIQAIKKKCNMWGSSGEKMLFLASKNSSLKISLLLNKTLKQVESIRSGKMGSQVGLEMIIISVTQNLNAKGETSK